MIAEAAAIDLYASEHDVPAAGMFARPARPWKIFTCGPSVTPGLTERLRPAVRPEPLKVLQRVALAVPSPVSWKITAASRCAMIAFSKCRASVVFADAVSASPRSAVADFLLGRWAGTARSRGFRDLADGVRDNPGPPSFRSQGLYLRLWTTAHEG